MCEEGSGSRFGPEEVLNVFRTLHIQTLDQAPPNPGFVPPPIDRVPESYQNKTHKVWNVLLNQHLSWTFVQLQ